MLKNIWLITVCRLPRRRLMTSWWKRKQPDWEVFGFFAVIIALGVLLLMVLSVGLSHVKG